MKEKNALHVDMGQRIRDRRIELRWTRESLAEKTELSSRFIACIETGQCGLSLDSLARMAQALGVSTDYLLFGSGHAPIPHDISDAIAAFPPVYYPLLVKQIRLFGDIIGR